MARPILVRSNSSFMVTSIIAINVVVFCLWWFAPGLRTFMIYNFLVSWAHLEDGRYWVLLTSVFSHNMLFHLFINMFVLGSFGRILERIMGNGRFLRFYLVAGLVSSLAHATVSNFILGEPGLPALGASGAIAGVVLLFSFLLPREKILIFGVIPVPALVGALAFIALDVWGLMAQAGGGGLPIGHGAHLGGAFTGMVYYLFFGRRLRAG